MPSPPRKCPRKALAARNNSRLMPEVVAKEPINRNSGTTAKFQSVTVRIEVWPTILRAGPLPLRYPKPATPTNPIAMPTGTLSSISTNKAMKPTTATTSPLMLRTSFGYPCRLGKASHRIGSKDQPVGAHRDQEHRRDVAQPSHREERPHRQPQLKRF